MISIYINNKYSDPVVVVFIKLKYNSFITQLIKFLAKYKILSKYLNNLQ